MSEDIGSTAQTGQESVGYWLRRAQEEAVAAIRATGVAAERHESMALAYSSRAVGLLGGQWVDAS